MKKPNEQVASQIMNDIVNFLETTVQFKYSLDNDSSKMSLVQGEDKKAIQFSLADIEKVLNRQDYDGSQFIQINFTSGSKILITKNLVGFKPAELMGFDSNKIPRVVTTVDLISVSKAIEDLYEGEESYQTSTEVEVLKKVYQSILMGAESVGFDMRTEKQWFSRFLLNGAAASA